VTTQLVTDDLALNGPQAARLVGITYRQLDHWDTTGVVAPSLTKADGQGSRRQYSYADLMDLLVVKTLADFGVGFNLIRRVMKHRGRFVRTDPASMLVVREDDVRIEDVTKMKSFTEPKVVVMIPLARLCGTLNERLRSV
jgi:DNA-binding transcriptional MerR regulator